MTNFLVSVDHDTVSGGYMACFAEGQVIMLNATTYHDAVLEADMLEPEDYAVGYNYCNRSLLLANLNQNSKKLLLDPTVLT